MTRTLPAGTLDTVSDQDEGPVTLRAAVLVLWIEAAALAVLTAFVVYKLVTDVPERPDLAVWLAAMIGLAAVGAYLFGRALVRRRAWARSPAIVLQLMALPVSFFMITGEGALGTRIGGVLIALVALLGAGLLLAPASRQALTVR
jgi:hypothetical protein